MLGSFPPYTKESVARRATSMPSAPHCLWCFGRMTADPVGEPHLRREAESIEGLRPAGFVHCLRARRRCAENQHLHRSCAALNLEGAMLRDMCSFVAETWEDVRSKKTLHQQSLLGVRIGGL